MWCFWCRPPSIGAVSHDLCVTSSPAQWGRCTPSAPETHRYPSWWMHFRAWKVKGYGELFYLFLPDSGRSCSLWLQTQNTVPAQSPCKIWHAASRDPGHALRWESGEQHWSVCPHWTYFLDLLMMCVCVCWQLWYCLVPPSAGEAVNFTRQYVLTPTSGRRPRVPGAVVIIADKKSADNLTLAASSLRASGVKEHNNKQSHSNHP